MSLTHTFTPLNGIYKELKLKHKLLLETKKNWSSLNSLKLWRRLRRRQKENVFIAYCFKMSSKRLKCRFKAFDTFAIFCLLIERRKET